MGEGMEWDNIPKDLIMDCAQLVKANSIEGIEFRLMDRLDFSDSAVGNKKDNLTIIYTPADNLKKTGEMEVGQVSFHNDKTV